MIGTATDFIDFAKSRGKTVTAEQAATALIKAADLLALQCWYGDQSGDDAWPRTGLVYDGRPMLDANYAKITGLTAGDVVAQPAIPLSVLNATYFLALDSASGVNLMPTVAGKQIVEERVEGAIDIKYAESSIGAAPYWPWWDSMLGPWMICEPESGINFTVYRG